MKKYEVTTEFDGKKIFTSDKKLIQYINELAEGSGYLFCEVNIREDKVIEITGNNEDGIDIEGIVNGKKFLQWYEDIEDFNDYFDTRLDLNDWENSVNEAKKTIEKYMQYYDCDKYTDEEIFG